MKVYLCFIVSLFKLNLGNTFYFPFMNWYKIFSGILAFEKWQFHNLHMVTLLFFPDPDWRQEEKGMVEDEMVGWHHQINGHESEQTLGDGNGQGILACCSPCGCKESDTTEWLRWTELKILLPFEDKGIILINHM